MVAPARGQACPSLSVRRSSAKARRLLQVSVLLFVVVLPWGLPLVTAGGTLHASVSFAALASRGLGPAVLVEGLGNPSPAGGDGPSASVGTPGGIPLGIVNSIHVGSAPVATAYDPGKNELFVVNSNTNNVSVIADGTGAVVATIAVGSFPYGIAYDSGRGEIFVANTGSSNVSVISDVTNRVVATVSLAVSAWPVGIAYDSGRGSVFVANIGSDSVDEISDATNAVINSVSTGTGSGPFGVAYDSGRSQIFVSLRNAGNVVVIDDSTLAKATILVGQTPMGVAYDAARSEVFVANNGSGSVSVIADVNDTVVAVVPVGANPSGIAYGPGTGDVAVTYTQTLQSTTFAMLGVIADGNNTVVARVGLYGGGAAQGVAYDSGNRGWYVTDTPVDTVVVVVTGSAGYDVRFTETGLPSGTLWQFWFNGTGPWGASTTRYASTALSTHLTAGNGTYTFTALPVAGYRVSPASGNVTVSGAPVSQSIAFAFLYGVTFTASGLPAGTEWSVTLAGTTERTNATRIVFAEPNGTFSFTAGAVAGYSASPASGTVTVSGASASQDVGFSPSGIALGNLAVYIAIGIVAVGIAAAAVVLLRRRGRGRPPETGGPPTSPGEPPSGGGAP